MPRPDRVNVVTPDAVQPVLDAWQTAPHHFAQYPAGSQGPKEADKLIGADDADRKWRKIGE